MGYDDKEASGIVCVVSRQVGTVAGTSVVISKRVADRGVKTVATAKDWLKRPLKVFVRAHGKKSSTTSEASALESMVEQETAAKKSAKSLINALESDLAAARRELQGVQSKAEKTQSQIASQLSKLQSEKESLLTELEQARSQANEAALQTSEAKTQAAVLEILETNLAAAQHNLEKSRKEDQGVKPQPSSAPGPVQTEHALPTPAEEFVVEQIGEKSESSTGTAVANHAENVSVRTKEQLSQPVSKVEVPSHPDVTEKQVRAAVFDNETQRVIFTRALSDIANQDPAARADAARTIAGIRHELSVKVLVGQMTSEPSAQVRQECIKALTTLQMTEGLGAVEQALSDRAGLVRLAAVWGLYRLAGAESGPALVRMLSDEDVEVRRRAATCIGWLGQEELAVELLPLLDDSSVSVRLAVVEAMGNLHCRQGVTALIERLNDPEKAVRKPVLVALKTITGKKMSGPFPRDKKSLQRLIARWRGWWKEEQ